MNLLDCLSRPELRKYVKNYAKGAFLFKQGDTARTMFIVLEGRVHLLNDVPNRTNTVSVIESGQFLGEKAILKTTAYQRAYSAKADIDTIALEVALSDLEQIQRTSPETAIEILKQILNVVDDRFDQANYMIRLLRSSNNVERLVHCIVYLSRVSGKKYRGGVEVMLNPENIHCYIDMEPKKIEASLKDLSRQRLIVPTEGGRYLIPNEAALLNYIPELIYQLAV